MAQPQAGKSHIQPAHPPLRSHQEAPKRRWGRTSCPRRSRGQQRWRTPAQLCQQSCGRNRDKTLEPESGSPTIGTQTTPYCPLFSATHPSCSVPRPQSCSSAGPRCSPTTLCVSSMVLWQYRATYCAAAAPSGVGHHSMAQMGPPTKKAASRRSSWGCRELNLWRGGGQGTRQPGLHVAGPHDRPLTCSICIKRRHPQGPPAGRRRAETSPPPAGMGQLRWGGTSVKSVILSLTGGDLRMPQPPPSTVSPHAAPPLPALPTVPFRQMHPVVCQGDPVREFPLRVHLLPPAGDATDISTDSAGPSSRVPPHVWPPGGTARMQGRPHAAQMSHGPPPPLTGCR